MVILSISMIKTPLFSVSRMATGWSNCWKMTGSNNDILSGGHRSVIKEHGVITFPWPRYWEENRSSGQTYWIFEGSFVRSFLSYFSLSSDLLGCDLLPARLPILTETSRHVYILYRTDRFCSNLNLLKSGFFVVSTTILLVNKNCLGKYREVQYEKDQTGIRTNKNIYRRWCLKSFSSYNFYK